MTIKFAIAQLNSTAGDLPANTNKILAWIREARRKRADFTVFPECALTGYPIWDLANKHLFIDETLKALEKITRATRGYQGVVILGFVDRSEIGDRSRNALAWIQNGKVVFKYYKRLLPTYDVFLEDIFFEPGTETHLHSYKGMRVGVTICEDIWDQKYQEKPLSDLARYKPDLVINISASPYYRGVAEVRDALLKHHTVHHGFPMLYVNRAGAQDDLIFDGRSLFVDKQGRILFRGPRFQESLSFFDWVPESRTVRSLPLEPDASSPKEIYQALVMGIRDYCAKNKFSKIVLGTSGGIDSALVACLASDAIGGKNVMGVTMPSVYSSRGSVEDSRELAKNLGMEFSIRPIKQKYTTFVKVFNQAKKKEGKKVLPKNKVTLAQENLQSRMRSMELMMISNDESRLVVATGNKSEMAMGYCTLYGDMAGGLAAIGDVYKTDIYRLAYYRNSIGKVIPEATLTKPPSAELKPNQKDQDTLLPYEILDEILYLYIEKNKSPEEIFPRIKSKKISLNAIRDVVRRVDHNEYKRRQTPPILRVTEKAWFGRRMPITNRFQF